jgi:hypothetical protein
MRGSREDSPDPRIASNVLGQSALGRAVVALPRAITPSDRVGVVLDSALDVCGAERAFLVAGAPHGAPPRVEAARSRRADGCAVPSRSALARALRAGDARPRAALDTEAASVRALDLTAVVALALPAVRPAKRALVLDSRRPIPLDEDGVLAELEALAALLDLALGPDGPGAPPSPDAEPGLCGRSEAMARLREAVGRTGATELPVLVEGETGSGKEAVARALHRASRRARGPIVTVNCAAVSETLLEAELFGAVRGAYTGAERDRPGLFRLAHGGSLVLDEVGDMPRSMQTKLLRALEEGRVPRSAGRTRSRSTSASWRRRGATSTPR